MIVTNYAIRPININDRNPLECVIDMRSGSKDNTGIISLSVVLHLENRDWSLLEIESSSLRQVGQLLVLMADNAQMLYETRGAGKDRASDKLTPQLPV